MEEKNFIIFMILSILLVFVWYTLFAPKSRPPEQLSLDGSTVAQAQGTTTEPGTLPGATLAGLPGATVGTTPAPAAGVMAGQTAAPGTETAASTKPARTVTITTDVYKVTFTDLGAAPQSWLLLDYPVEKCFPVKVVIAWPPVLMDPPCDDSPVDLVEKGFGPGVNSFMAQVKVDQLEPLSPNARWEIESTDLEIGDGETAGVVAFKTSLPDGRVVHKIYRFQKSGYQVGLTLRIDGEAPRTSLTDLAMLYTFNPLGKSGVPRWNFNGPLVQGQSKVDRIDPEDVIDDKTISATNLRWAGFTSDYFLTAMMADEERTFSFVVKYDDGGLEPDKKAAKNMVGWVRVPGDKDRLAEGELADVTLFIGPKDPRILREVRESLVESVDYGRLSLLVKPLLWLLYHINLVVHNYGVAIIILTIIVRMLTLPLTWKSQKSMKAMQKLQPEIKAIREKYADDKMKQQEEMQAVWRRNKINPAMGCLPILLQMPVFFAFYKALLISIELRQAPFFLWINDLSARDPLYIWPVAMGVTQLITQKLTPTQAQMDQTQAKIMMAMPIVFTYILRDFPAGLLIYWTFQNIVGIGQQIFINRRSD